LLTIVFFFLYLKEKQQQAVNSKAAKESQHSLEEQVKQTNRERTQFLEDKITLGNQLAEQKTLNHSLQQQIEDQLKKQQNLIEENRLQFENLSNKLLDEKAAKFTKQNRENLDQLLKPFQEKIKAFEKKVDETY